MNFWCLNFHKHVNIIFYKPEFPRLEFESHELRPHDWSTYYKLIKTQYVQISKTVSQKKFNNSKLYIYFLSGVINLGPGKLNLFSQTGFLLVYGPDESGKFDSSLICYRRWLYDQCRITQSYCIWYVILRLPSFYKNTEFIHPTIAQNTFPPFPSKMEKWDFLYAAGSFPALFCVLWSPYQSINQGNTLLRFSRTRPSWFNFPSTINTGSSQS